MEKQKMSVITEYGSIFEYNFNPDSELLFGNQDSAGHDTHDGAGKGHERGDHTNYGLFVRKREHMESMKSLPSSDATLEEILNAHTSSVC